MELRVEEKIKTNSADWTENSNDGNTTWKADASGGDRRQAPPRVSPVSPLLSYSWYNIVAHTALLVLAKYWKQCRPPSLEDCDYGTSVTGHCAAGGKDVVALCGSRRKALPTRTIEWKKLRVEYGASCAARCFVIDWVVSPKIHRWSPNPTCMCRQGFQGGN